VSIDFKSIVRDHVPESTNSQNFDSWYCRTCDKWMRHEEAQRHLVEKLQEAEQKQLDALVMYRGMWLAVSREVDVEDWGGYIDMQNRLESISNILKKMEMPK
jgi:hypothetical protein